MILKNLSFEKLGLSFCFHSSRWPWLCHGPAWIIYLDNVLIRQFGKQSCHQRMKTLNIFTANIKKFGLKFWVKKIKFHHIFTKYGLIKGNQFIVHLRTNVLKLAEKSSRGHEILVIHSVQIQTYVISAEYNKFYLPFNCFVGRKNCDYFTRKKILKKLEFSAEKALDSYWILWPQRCVAKLLVIFYLRAKSVM